MRFFNTTGPVIAEDHYTIPAQSRWDMDEIEQLIREKRYFVLHAPRQTGKTSCLLSLMDKLNEGGQYTALYVNLEPGQAARGNVEAGMSIILDALVSSAEDYLDDRLLSAIAQEIITTQAPGSLFREGLRRWCKWLDKPLVLLLDEVDTLVGDTLISLLRQIRADYPKRPTAFPQTVLLCGMRDIRDYRIHTADNEIITGGSAFNIKSDSLCLGNFSCEDVIALYGQHTEETGQDFTVGVVDYVFEQTDGQPWLVNALGYEACFRPQGERERARPITMQIMMEARERLIERQDTHIDQLANQLKASRVYRVIGKILADTTGEGVTLPDDDLQYVEDLGLIRTRPGLAIANPIYREIIPRALTWTAQVQISQEAVWYIRKDGRLDMPKLLDSFQQFFRENSEVWLNGFRYIEAGPQLLMQAFLQRIVNGGGRIDREYGLGRRRTDLLVQWPRDQDRGFYGPVQRVVIELKIQRKSLEATLQEGMEQTADYMDRVGAEEGYLITFNRDPDTKWEKKLFVREGQHGKYRIGLWGM